MFFIFGLLPSTALYGIFALLVASIGFHIPLATMFQATFEPTSFINVFYAFMIWAPVAYIILSLLNYLVVRIRGVSISFLSEQMSILVASFSSPWRGLVSLVGATQVIDSYDLYGLYCWFQVIVHFLWAIGLFGFIGYGFYLIVK